VMTELAADGVPADDLKPLADLKTLIALSRADPQTMAAGPPDAPGAG
jgi:hypothetical protein